MCIALSVLLGYKWWTAKIDWFGGCDWVRRRGHFHCGWSQGWRNHWSVHAQTQGMYASEALYFGLLRSDNMKSREFGTFCCVQEIENLCVQKHISYQWYNHMYILNLIHTHRHTQTELTLTETQTELHTHMYTCIFCVWHVHHCMRQRHACMYVCDRPVCMHVCIDLHFTIHYMWYAHTTPN